MSKEVFGNSFFIDVFSFASEKEKEISCKMEKKINHFPSCL